MEKKHVIITVVVEKYKKNTIENDFARSKYRNHPVGKFIAGPCPRVVRRAKPISIAEQEQKMYIISTWKKIFWKIDLFSVDASTGRLSPKTAETDLISTILLTPTYRRRRWKHKCLFLQPFDRNHYDIPQRSPCISVNVFYMI